MPWESLFNSQQHPNRKMTAGDYLSVVSPHVSLTILLKAPVLNSNNLSSFSSLSECFRNDCEVTFLKFPLSRGSFSQEEIGMEGEIKFKAVLTPTAPKNLGKRCRCSAPVKKFWQEDHLCSVPSSTQNSPQHL